MSLFEALFFGDVLQSEFGSEIVKYYGYVMMVLLLVIIVVLYMGTMIMNHSYSYRNFKNRQMLEYVWTAMPTFLLAMLWCPSILNLYRMEDLKDPVWSFKAVGKQWYWTYEVNLKDGETMVIDSYMDRDSGVELESGYRLLDVDWRLVAPADAQISCYVTSSDVIHSFALPGALLKADAIPGRINVLPMKISQSCILYGQCSEICGINHSFMPIVIEFVPVDVFMKFYGYN
nr:cytochrome c oxidase subunit II [Perna perna]UVH65879.1 cytochrome c oxidase subunit II [Perna perna]UVH65892.1 cytochrome c oxidase subunit II [Perna perna]UVH65905.1 cytochrome c oxidase subunit II [Perna perna]WRV01103.1 cytochrome c oxidase subunit II [Perna perna]